MQKSKDSEAKQGPEAERSQSAATLEEAMALNEKNALAEAERLRSEGEERVEQTRTEYEAARDESQPSPATGIGDTGETPYTEEAEPKEEARTKAEPKA